MKKSLLIILFFIFISFCLEACLKQQSSANGNSTNTSSTSTEQDINDTNYQDMLREQASRASEIDASYVHGESHGH